MTNYSRGRAREYKTMELLREKGYVCSRSAMSHGPVDVFAAKGGKILLVQVKSGSARIKKDELKLLKKWATAFDAEAQVWSFKKRGRLLKVTVRARVAGKQSVQVENSTLGLEAKGIEVPGASQPLVTSVDIKPAEISDTAESLGPLTVSSHPLQEAASRISPPPASTA